MTEKPMKTPNEELECNSKYIYDTGIIFECKNGCQSELLGNDVVDLLNELHEENQSYKQNVSKTIQKHYNRLVELSNNGGEDECGFMVFIKFLSQELDVELEDLE